MTDRKETTDTMLSRANIEIRLMGLLQDMDDLGCPGEWRAVVEAAEQEIRRLRDMVTPKPLAKAPKDKSRSLIGVERPPYEDRTYYYMIEWREDKQEWMTQVDIDWSSRPAQYVYANCGAEHYLDPQEFPGLPYWEGSDEDYGQPDEAQEWSDYDRDC